MLALSRKPGESVIIGNNIEITILEVKGEQVKVGIKAPESVAIYRKELFEQIQNSNRESSEINEQTLKNLNKIFE
ncbi:MAG: carbon storage regulator CsrA [Catonella sp.]|uniref:carbon storage regulator CsrA n=1 Tax=Catonella sp. TaxID=2382125 RepID=UPI003FA10355